MRLNDSNLRHNTTINQDSNIFTGSGGGGGSSGSSGGGGRNTLCVLFSGGIKRREGC